MRADRSYNTASECRRLKIAMIAHLKYPIAEPFSGGLEMHTHLLVSKLRRRGHDVTLFASCGSDDAQLRKVCHPTALLNNDPASSETVDAVERSAYSAIVGMLQDEKFDIIHFNALHSLPLQRASTLRAPVVAVLHTPPFSPFDAAVEEASSQVTVVAVSESLATAWPMIRQPPLVIDNGIDLIRFPFNRPKLDDRFVFWSGRIVPEKGLHFAIDAAARASIDLKIAGPICDREYWQFEIEPRLGTGATYLGHLSQSALAERLGMATVAICTPCWEEPFGLVVVEALACGTPVAGFARGALPYILDSSCGALAPAGDVDGLAAAIGRCLGLDRRACRLRAETKFDAEQMMDRYEALYRSMADPIGATVGSAVQVFESVDA